MKKYIIFILFAALALQGFTQVKPNPLQVYQGAKKSSFVFGTKQFDIWGDATHCYLDFTGNRPFYFLDSLFVNGQRVLTLTDTNTYATSTNSGFLKYSDWALFNAKQPAGSYLVNADTTNKYYSKTATDNRLNLKLNSSDTSRLNTTGDIGYGTYTFKNTLNTIGRGLLLQQTTADANGSKLYIDKSRGTITSPSVITTADTLGEIMFRGYDGSAFRKSASITALSGGTIGVNRVPSSLIFNTATDAAPGVITERMRIDNAGYIGVNIAPSTSYRLRIGGTLSCATSLTFEGAGTTGQISWGGGGATLSATSAYTALGNYNIITNVSLGSSLYINNSGFVGIAYLAPTNPSFDLSFGGTATRVIGMERHTVANTQGQSLTIKAGSATTGSGNKNGGSLILQSGYGSGSDGVSYTSIQSHLSRAHGSAATTDNSTFYDRFLVNSTKILADNVNDTLFSVQMGSDSSVTFQVDYGVNVVDNDSSQAVQGTYRITASANGAGALRSTTFSDTSYPDAGMLGTLTNTPLLIYSGSPRKVYVVVKYDTSIYTVAGEMKMNFNVVNTSGNFTNYTLY